MYEKLIWLWGGNLTPLRDCLTYSNWHWYYFFYFLIVYQTANILWQFWWKAPSNIIIAAYPTPLGRWFTALRMVFDSEVVLQKAYESSNGNPFAIPMTDHWIVFVSNPDQLRKLESEPEHILSTEEALHELAFIGPILGHLQVPPEHKGPRSEAFRVMISVLKNRLRANTPLMSDCFKTRIKEAVALEVASGKEISQGEDNDWKSIRIMPALLRILTRVNLVIFVGDYLATRPDVYRDVMAFFNSCATAFPILSLMPNFLLPFAGPIVMGWGVTRQRVYTLLLWLTNQSLDGKDSINCKSSMGGNITQWIAEMTKLKDSIEIAKVLLGLMYASAFQIPIAVQSCIHSFCKHPEYHEILRAEAVQAKDEQFGSLNQEMPYLDSFMKETARLNPNLILSGPRAIMAPYTSPQGYHVPTRNWIAIPQISIMRKNNKVLQTALQLEGFRYVDEENGTSKSRFTHPSYYFPFWGSISPARFYASVAMKMILSHLIVDYEFKLADPDARPFLTFGKTRLPNPFMDILIRKRTAERGEAGAPSPSSFLV